jgi:hypothetical protein
VKGRDRAFPLPEEAEAVPVALSAASGASVGSFGAFEEAFAPLEAPEVPPLEAATAELLPPAPLARATPVRATLELWGEDTLDDGAAGRGADGD